MENIQKTTAPGSVVVLTGTIPAATLTKERAHALAHMQHHVEVDGFRKGSVPEQMIVAKYGERAVQEAAAEHAVSHVISDILVNNGVMPITTPNVSIELLADGSAKAEIKCVVYPTVTLPDYQKIATDVMKDKVDVVLTEEEVTDALTHFKRERVRIEAVEAGEEQADATKKAEETAPEELPPLDDEFVKAIGFDNAAAFEKNIRDNLHTSKQEQQRSEYRAKILKEIGEKIDTDVPEALVEYEQAKMEAGLAHYVGQMGMKLEDYYTKINKKREDVFLEWKDEATQRARQQLALIEIARKEKINEDEKELNALVDDIRAKDPSADEVAVRSHYQVILRNEKVMQWLESQK